MASGYENPRDQRGLKALGMSGQSGHKIDSVVPGAPAIVFTARKLTVDELKKTKKCKYNLRDASMLNKESVRDIKTDMKDENSNKAPAYGYIEGGVIYIIAGNRRKETIIQNGSGTLLIFIADNIRDEDKIALSKSFDIYVQPGAADKATTYLELIEKSKAELDAGLIDSKDVITQNQIAKIYNSHKSTVSKLVKAAPLVKLFDLYFPVKSLIHYNFLTKLVEGNKENLDKTANEINKHKQAIQEFAESKKAQIDDEGNYDSEKCTSDIEKFILSLLFSKEKTTPDTSEYEEINVKRKGLSISRKANGNLSINVKYDSQTNEVIELIKMLANSE